MDSLLKKKLRALSLALRHTLEGSVGQAGDLEGRLNQMGVWRDRPPKSLEELGLSAPDHAARRIVDAFLNYRAEAGVSQGEAFAEFVRESAYSWANRLFMLRCLESRELIDEVILQKQVYGGRSLVHHRFAQQNPSACAGEDDGLFSVLEEEFRRRATELPTVFDPEAPAIALRPSISALRRCIGLLSGTISINGQGEAGDDLFEAGDAPGWAYQFWNAEEKDRVFERVRTEKGAKIEGADLIPATQLYTEPYMVKFLVQNSLGALWAGMNPETKLPNSWEYYVRDADRNPPVQPDPPPFDPAKPPTRSTDPWIRPNPGLYVEAEIVAYARTLSAAVHGAEAGGFVDLRNQLLDAGAKPLPAKLVLLNQEICEAWNHEWPARRPKLKKRAAEITFLDPACGSGHFLLEAFDLLYSMYEEEGIPQTPEDICASVLNHNLFGIDIDERAVQISVAALWMHALKRARHLNPESVTGLREHLVAANLSLPRGRAHLEEFLAKHPEDAELRPALEAVFRGLADASQLGTLVRVEEPVEQELKRRKEADDQRAETVLRQSQVKLDFMAEQYVLTARETRDYAAWKQELLERLKRHFLEEAAVSDPVQGFFGREARQGLAIFDLLARRYDVVAANPPYMGSGNMGWLLKGYCSLFYSLGKRDLYAVFIQRCRDLCRFDGYVAMVTQQSWMFLPSFVELRSDILMACTVEILVHLGEHGFNDPSAAGAFVTLFCLRKSAAKSDHRLTAFRLIGPTRSEEKDSLLLFALHEDSDIVFTTQQSDFLRIPGSPLSYWLRKRFFELLSGTTLGDVADLAEPSTTGDNVRFMRASWEVGDSSRWVWASRGGGYRKWTGCQNWVMDWQYSGARVKARPGSYIRNEHMMFRPGLTYTESARGSAGFRQMAHDETFAKSGPGVFPREITLEECQDILNCRITSYFLRITSRSFMFSLGSLALVPMPAVQRPEHQTLNPHIMDLKRRLMSLDPTERAFSAPNMSADSFVKSLTRGMADLHACSADLLCLEGRCERVVIEQFGIDARDLSAITDETGVSADWQPLLDGYTQLLTAAPSHSKTVKLTDPELEVLKQRLHDLYADTTGSSGDAENPEQELTEDAEEELNRGASIPIRSETQLEELSRKIQIHPLSVYRLLEEMWREDRLVCRSEMRRLAEDCISVLVLRLLGHRWPKEIGAGDLMSEWTEAEGIISVTESYPRSALLRRCADRLKEAFGSNAVSEFDELVGISLGHWLEQEFYPRHVRQFRTRPIVWQIQTRAPGGGVPVLSCLVYYHRIAGAIPNLRIQYAGTLRGSFESELRTLESLTQLTADQSTRKAKLVFWVEELKVLQEGLEAIEARGFMTAELRHYAVIDAVHSLARRWLARLREELRNGPLPGWREKADKDNLHPDFSCWIGDAVEHVDRHCVAVAPDAPAPDSPDKELTPNALAESFRGPAPSMIRIALERVCREWQSRFDKALLQPLREQIKAADEEYKQLEDNIENKLERKDLKSRVKALKSEIASLSAKSGVLAERIREWRCTEAETWVDWLAMQPLYDEFTSLDGRRPIPQTVAELVSQESQYVPDVNDGVRVNISPLQKAGILACDVLATKDVEKAIADRAEWRADERRWCRQGVLPQPGWWPEPKASTKEGEDTA